MTSGELKLFLRMFPDYCRHFKENKHSLLSKILGVFTVRSSKMGAVHIMLMENCLRLHNPDNLKYIFDLKGSLVDRKVKGKTKKSTTLKDVNFLMAARENQGLTKMNRSITMRLRKALYSDVEFLKSHNLMDYSLLIGIEKISNPEDLGVTIPVS
jgi:hypothetical protein